MNALELLQVDGKRFGPRWAQVPDSVKGSPRLFAFAHCRQLIEQLKSAPVADAGSDAGECVDPKWATSHGHAVDALRYGAMSRPSASMLPPLPEPRTDG